MGIELVLLLAWLFTHGIYRGAVGTWCAATKTVPPWVQSRQERLTNREIRRADTPGGDAHLPVTQPEVELSVCARVTWGLWRRAPQAAEIVNGNYRIVPGSKRRCRGGGESPRGDDA